jgi:hypothetical protein
LLNCWVALGLWGWPGLIFSAVLFPLAYFVVPVMAVVRWGEVLPFVKTAGDRK